MEKYKIEKDTVQETLVIPLYGKYQASKRYPDLFGDAFVEDLWDGIDYDFKKPPNFKLKIGAIMAGTRQYDLAWVCREYLKDHPQASVVNLGCGLDTTFYQVDNGQARGYNLDFPQVIDIRNSLLPAQASEQNIPADLNDFSWFEKIDFQQDKGAVFFASGVFYYFKREDVKKLFSAMVKAFPGGKIVFDATNAKGLKKMLKVWLGPADMKNIGAYFSLEDKGELEAWSRDFKKVTSKGYMTGYRGLDKRYGVLANALFKYVDRKNLSKIIEIQF